MLSFLWKCEHGKVVCKDMIKKHALEALSTVPQTAAVLLCNKSLDIIDTTQKVPCYELHAPHGSFQLGIFYDCVILRQILSLSRRHLTYFCSPQSIAEPEIHGIIQVGNDLHNHLVHLLTKHCQLYLPLSQSLSTTSVLTKFYCHRPLTTASETYPQTIFFWSTTQPEPCLLYKNYLCYRHSSTALFATSHLILQKDKVKKHYK